MKPKTTIVLVALLVACVAYVVIVHTDLGHKESTPTDEQAEKLLFPDVGEPVELIVDRDDGSVLQFAKRNGQWWIVKPYQAEAEDWRVKDISRLIEDLPYVRSFDPQDRQQGLPDSQTGLDKPRWTVTLRDEKGRTYKVFVGKHVPLQRGAETYVRPAGQTLTYVARRDFHAELSRDPQDYRKSTVLRALTDRIVRVKIAGAENYEIEKFDKNRYRIVSPVAAPADRQKVRSFLDRFRYVHAIKFVDDDPKDLSTYGLDKPRLIATVWVEPEQTRKKPQSRPAASAPATAPLGAAASRPASAPASQPTSAPGETLEIHTIIFGNTVGQRVYAKLADKPSVFLLERNVMDNMQPKLMTLRDRRIARLKIDDVKRIDLDLPDGHAELIKRGSDWWMLKPFEGPAQKATVNTLLANVTVPKVERFLDDAVTLAAYGLDQPRAKIALHAERPGQSQTILIGSATPSGEMTFVKNADSPSVAIIRTSDAEKLLAPVARYWSTRLLDLPSQEKITQLIIERPGVTYALAREDDGAWRLSEPVESATDASHVNRLLEALRRLDAEQVVTLGKTVPDKYARDKRKLRVTIVTATPSTPSTQSESQPASGPSEPTHKTYVFNLVELDGLYYGWIENSQIAAVGRFKPQLYKTLTQELRDRTVLKLQPDRIEKIRRVAGEEVFELARRKDQWVYTQDPFVEIDPKKVEQFLKDLRRVEAVRFVSHDTSAAKRFGLDEPWFGLELTDADGKVMRIVVSNSGAGETTDRYATSSETQGIFLLSGETIGDMTRDLAYFAK